MEKEELIRLLKLFILDQDIGARLLYKEVKKMTPNQGGIYLPKEWVGRTVTITLFPEESRDLKKIDKRREESFKLDIIEEPKKEEEVEVKELRKSVGEVQTATTPRPPIEEPSSDPDRFNIDLNPKPKKDGGI